MNSAEHETYQAAWQSLADKSEQLGLLSGDVLLQIVDEIKAMQTFSPKVQQFLQAVIDHPHKSAGSLKQCSQNEIQNLHQLIEKHYRLSHPTPSGAQTPTRIVAESMALLDFDSDSFDDDFDQPKNHFEDEDDQSFELLAFDAVEATPDELHRNGLYLLLQILMAHYYLHYVAEKAS